MPNNLDQKVVGLYEDVAGKREGLREDVLRYTLLGMVKMAIAEKLGITVSDVRQEQQAIFAQAGVKDRFELFRKLLDSVIE